jgi:hypothetical protein
MSIWPPWAVGGNLGTTGHADSPGGGVSDHLNDPGGTGVHGIVFSPGAILAASGLNPRLYLWNVATGKVTATLPPRTARQSTTSRSARTAALSRLVRPGQYLPMGHELV